MIFKRNVNSYKGFSALGKIREDSGIMDDFRKDCKELQGICGVGEGRDMPWHMPWHAKANALACPGVCLGMPRHMPWHACQGMGEACFPYAPPNNWGRDRGSLRNRGIRGSGAKQI